MGRGKNKKNKARAAAATATATDVPVNGDEQPVDSGAAPLMPASAEPANGDEHPPANGDGDTPLQPSLEAANGDELPVGSAAAANLDAAPWANTVEASNGDEIPLDSAATVNGNKVPPPPPSVEAANGGEPMAVSGAPGKGDGNPPPMLTSVEPANGDGDAPPPALEAANGDETPVDSKAVANGDGVDPPPSAEEADNGCELMAERGLDEEAPQERRDSSPEPERQSEKLEALNDAPPPALEAANGDKTPVDSAAVANSDVVEPPPSAEEADNGGELIKERGLDVEAPEERQEPRTEPEGEAEKLKARNDMLVKEAVETRGQVAALTAQVDERSAEASALAVVDRDVLKAALVGPLLAAAEYVVAQHGHLADVQESLQAAEARAGRETDARAEAAARLESAGAENHRFEEVLGGKDAEAASASRNVAGLEAVVSELAGKSTELSAERGELEKRLGELSASVRSVHAQKAEVEASFRDYKMNSEMYKQEIQEKLDEKSKQLEALRSSKTEMEVKLQSLEAELSAAVARNRELEFEMDTGKTELAAAKTELDKLLLEIADVGAKYTTVVAEADSLRNEIDKMMTITEAAVSALATEKTKFEQELVGMKRKADLIKANKDAAMASARDKDAEAAKLRSELNGLSDSIAEQRVLCDDLRAKSSSLQDEVDTLQKALGEEKAEGGKLRSRLGEVENHNGQKDREIKLLKTEVQNKRGHIYTLNEKVQHLQLAVADAKQRGKSGVWTWLCPTTTVIAAVSFAYAARSR